jgi:hypothetical protein
MDPPLPRPTSVELESEIIRRQQTGGPSTKAIMAMGAGPVMMVQPVVKAESPSTKRRQSQEISPGGYPSDISSSKPYVPKRARSMQTPVKILPAKYEFCEVEDMVVLIANMISELIQTNDGLPLRSGVLTRFHSR